MRSLLLQSKSGMIFPLGSLPDNKLKTLSFFFWRCRCRVAASFYGNTVTKHLVRCPLTTLTPAEGMTPALSKDGGPRLVCGCRHTLTKARLSLARLRPPQQRDSRHDFKWLKGIFTSFWPLTFTVVCAANESQFFLLLYTASLILK